MRSYREVQTGSIVSICLPYLPEWWMTGGCHYDGFALNVCVNPFIHDASLTPWQVHFQIQLFRIYCYGLNGISRGLALTQIWICSSQHGPFKIYKELCCNFDGYSFEFVDCFLLWWSYWFTSIRDLSILWSLLPFISSKTSKFLLHKSFTCLVSYFILFDAIVNGVVPWFLFQFICQFYIEGLWDFICLS